MATSPIDLHWSLTTPEANSAGTGAKTYKPSEVAANQVPTKYLTITDSYLQFKAPVLGQPTQKSEKTRTEFREWLADGSNECNWSGLGGNHSMGAALTVVSTPKATGSMFIGQIHAEDGASPLFKFQYVSDGSVGKVVASFRSTPTGKANNSDVKTNIALNARIQYYVQVNSAGLLSAYVLVDGKKDTFSADVNDWMKAKPDQLFYFKAGIYNDATPEEAVDVNDISQALFYKLTTTHA